MHGSGFFSQSITNFSIQQFNSQSHNPSNQISPLEQPSCPNNRKWTGFYRLLKASRIMMPLHLHCTSRELTHMLNTFNSTCLLPPVSENENKKTTLHQSMNSLPVTQYNDFLRRRKKFSANIWGRWPKCIISFQKFCAHPSNIFSTLESCNAVHKNEALSDKNAPSLCTDGEGRQLALRGSRNVAKVARAAGQNGTNEIKFIKMMPLVLIVYTHPRLAKQDRSRGRLEADSCQGTKSCRCIAPMSIAYSNE